MPRVIAPPAERLNARADKSGGPEGCYLWLGSTDHRGYGRISVNGKVLQAHRVAYELAYGPIPSDMEIDHVKARGCRHRNCVNPAHLEAVTHATNVLRGESLNGQNARKTHCIHGHPFDESNTRYRAGRRECRACDKQRSRDRRAREAARRHTISRH